MSKFTIEDLLRTAPGDGASMSSGVSIPPLDYDDLLKAWAIERGHNIECEFLLDLSRITIAQLLENVANQSLIERIDTDNLIEQINIQLRKYATKRT